MSAETQLDELESLLLDWEEDSLDDPSLERLRAILRSDADARERYVQWQMLRAAMHLDGDAGLGLAALDTQTMTRDAKAETDASPARSHRWISLLLAIAASLLICVLVGRWAVLETRWSKSQQAADSPPPIMPAMDPAVEATSEGIALVTRLVDVAWDDSNQAADVGDALSPGKLAIRSGYAQIEFFCGATVVLEGPAELELESSTTARFRHGRLRAQVPPAARGFEILVDELRVVDLGTEFGISVSPDGADVQVFDGEVELHQPQTETRLITAGQAVMRTPTGAIDQSELTPDSFVDIESLDARAENQTASRYQRWLEHSRKLREDSRLIAYYAMDESRRWKRKLQSSLEPINNELDGAIVGARRVDGRWPAKASLEFKSPGDRVRVQIPGEFSSLTLVCWVKIDSLDRWLNSLFLTDDFQRGEPHWQILQNGQLQFSVGTRDGKQGPPHKELRSPPFWSPSMSGQWLHLATSYDVERKTATHYLNGELLSEETIPDMQLVPVTRIGRASIGNWSMPTIPNAKFAIRNLNGSIDEFAIFSAALSKDEIAEMYDNGKP